MEVTGKIIVALPEQSGVSRAGNNWKKREYVLETQETYPKKIFFSFFGERADQYPLAVGEYAKVSFDIDAREYNGRWYTEIRAFRAEKVDAAAAASPYGAPAQAAPAPAQPYGAPAAPAQPYGAPAAPAQTYGAPVPPVAPAAPQAGPADDLPF